MSLQCDVFYDNNVPVYRPGDMISGQVKAAFQERLLLKALSVRIAGYALIRWEKPPKRRKKKKYEKGQIEEVQVVDAAQQTKPGHVYSYREDYISVLNYYIGSEAATARTVERGMYTYHFAACLPERCPSAFETDLGYVRYELEVLVDYQDRCESLYCRSLPVQNPIDLRVDRSMMQPLEIEFPEKKSLLKFWTKALHVLVNTPQRGYVPGESISVYVKVMNFPHLKLNEIIYKFNLIGTYMGEYKKKMKVKQLRTPLVQRAHSLAGHTEGVVQHLDLMLVPATPANTSAAQCKCLQLEYEVEVVVTTHKRKRFVVAQLPIKIGTISLRSELRDMPTEFGGGTVSAMQTAYSMENLGGVQVFPAASPMPSSISVLALDTTPIDMPIRPKAAPRPNYAKSKKSALASEPIKEMELTAAEMKAAEAAASGAKVGAKTPYDGPSGSGQSGSQPQQLPPPPTYAASMGAAAGYSSGSAVELRPNGGDMTSEKRRLLYSDVEYPSIHYDDDDDSDQYDPFH